MRIVENYSRHHLDDLSVVSSEYLTLQESLSNAYFLNATFEHALQHTLIFMDLGSSTALIKQPNGFRFSRNP